MKKSFIKIMASLAMIILLISGCGSNEDINTEENSEDEYSYEENTDENIEPTFDKDYTADPDIIRQINPYYDHPEEYEIGYDFFLDTAWNRLTLGDDGSICDTGGNPIPNYSGVKFEDATILMVGDVYVSGYYADEASRIIKIVDEYAASGIYYTSGEMVTNLMNNINNYPEEFNGVYTSILAQCSYSNSDGFFITDQYGNELGVINSEIIPMEGYWVIVSGFIDTELDDYYIDACDVTFQPLV